MPTNPQKQLQRLPHVFSQVLELPLRSDANVFIEDRSDCFRFTVNIEDSAFSGQVKAHVVNIHPEVTKVVVSGGNGGVKVGMAHALKSHPEVTKVVIMGGNTGGEVELLDKLVVDLWRYRLPETARPELVTAVVIGRELNINVPKGGRSS